MLGVLRTAPEPVAQPEAIVTVTFDRPLAGGLDEVVDPAALLRIEPDMEGRAEWRDSFDASTGSRTSHHRSFSRLTILYAGCAAGAGALSCCFLAIDFPISQFRFQPGEDNASEG